MGKVCTKNDCTDGSCDISYRLDSTATLTTVNIYNGSSSSIVGRAFGNGRKGSRLIVETEDQGFRTVDFVRVSTFTKSISVGEGFSFFENSANPDESDFLSFFITVGNTIYTPFPLSQVPLGGEDRCVCTNGDTYIPCNSEKGKICCLKSSLVRQLSKKLR